MSAITVLRKYKSSLLYYLTISTLLIPNLIIRVQSFSRTVSADSKFEDEPKPPTLGNLATHLRNKHPEEISGAAPTTGNAPSQLNRSGITPGSALCMKEFVAEGIRNPKVEPTQRGFYRVFAAWAVDDDQARSVGETPSIARLFKYMESRFLLPSDTMVRKCVGELFILMRDKVTVELSVLHYFYHNI